MGRSWFFRQGILFGLILAAVVIHHYVTDTESSVQSAISNEWKSNSEIQTVLAYEQQQAIKGLKASQSDLLAKSGDALKAAIADRKTELSEIEKDLAERQGIFPEIRPTAIIAEKKLRLRQFLLLRELEVLNSVEILEASQLKLNQISYPSQLSVKSAKSACSKANSAVKTFNGRAGAEKAARNLIFGSAAELTRDAKDKCGNYLAKKSKRDEGLVAGEAARKQLETSRSSVSQATTNMANGLISYSTKIPDQTVQTLLMKALLLFVGILLTPFVIRTIFYYFLAPLAERRAAIRISVPGGGNVPIPLVEQSRVSLPITLGENEELLVRQDYLQTSSISGKKDTRWLLDYRHVLSSIASGLSFLTRIRGAGEITTVSAVRDPFAELAEVTLPPGAACVLHPRALVAAVQPIGQTMRITSQWRLLSLNAWLTLQLRYMIFHGPSKLIIKGGRGIRVESAKRGRIFGQDQLVGFSSDLAYSVTRTETFGPYFFGREQLFKDKVEEGSGILIIEEAPLSSRSGIRGGLEGVLDATMKAFGL